MKMPNCSNDSLDLLITGGKYPDFSKGEFVHGNIGIKDGVITYIGADMPDAVQIIDARKRIVSPGFIDIHMHEENFAEDGLTYIVGNLMLKMGVTTACGGNCGMQNQRLKEFKSAIEQLGGSPVNYVMMAGYNHMRYLLDLGHDEKMSKAQRKEIAVLLREELAEGAAGISFGIEYDQGICYEDMVEALMVLKESDPNGRCLGSAHFRLSGSGAIDSINEMASLCRETGVKFQISHLSSCSATGQMEESLALINRCIDENPLLNYDTYPYDAFSTLIGSAVFEKESLEQWCDDIGKIMLTQEPYKNVFLDEELLKKARAEYPEMTAVGFTMNEDEIAAAIANPKGMIGSDAILNKGNGHPRASGTFPRVLGKYVREEGVITLIDALRKMTFDPAERLSLFRKGRIEIGADADITIFDPETIIDGAAYDDIYIQPEGLDYVLISGEIAMDHKQTMNDRLGKFISYRDVKYR